MTKTTAKLGLGMVAIIWGSGYISTQLALDSGLTPAQVTTLRFFLSSILLCIMFYKKLKHIKKSTINAGAILGLTLSIAFLLQTYGLLYTTPSKNAFITALSVVIVPIIGFVIYKRGLDKISILSSIIAVIGIGILSLQSDLSINKGDILTLLCSFSFALNLFFTGEFTRENDPISLTIVQMITTFLISFAFILITGDTHFIINIKGASSIGALAIFNTMVNYSLQALCMTKTSQNETAIILSTESIWGTIFSVIIFKEILTFKMILGCIIIFMAIVMTETKLNFLKKKDVSKT